MADPVDRHAESMSAALERGKQLNQRLRELTGVSIGPFRPSLDQMTELVEWCEARAKIEEKAVGLVRTAHPTDVGRHEVVRQWWDALVAALR